MTQSKPHHHQSKYEREINASIRMLRKVHNDKNNRLRILYNYLHCPRFASGVSLAAFLQARAHIPQSEYPNEATMGRNAMAEILEIKSKMPGLEKDYDRLLSHRGVLRAGKEYDNKNRELEGQIGGSHGCADGGYNRLWDAKGVKEPTFHQAFTMEADGTNTEFATIHGLFDHRVANSTKQPQGPEAVRDRHEGMIEQPELKFDWGQSRVPSHNPSQLAFTGDGLMHENVGNGMELETMQRPLETSPDEQVGMTGLLEA
ncbi:hypothetical protein DFP73DRAFT_524681 [Morchella snyderi]|nr:hypothetical protein DFP73DRAFT_524681 [Morchella snyderi]